MFWGEVDEGGGEATCPSSSSGMVRETWRAKHISVEFVGMQGIRVVGVLFFANFDVCSRVFLGVLEIRLFVGVCR